MAFFDFLKKKEFEEIEILHMQVESNRDYYLSKIASLEQQLVKYKSITNINQELENKKFELDRVTLSRLNELGKLQNELDDFNLQYQNALEIYKKLRREISNYESKLEFIEFGVYEPIFDFEKSDNYREEQNRIIDAQKGMVKNDTAAVCTTKWFVQDSEAKGRLVVNRYKKLMLRAFNGECNSLIAKVKWNNIHQLKERMTKVFEAVNTLGEGFQVHICNDYFNLKESELILEYEYQAKKQREKEEMRAIQDELREEEKARRDFEKAQRDAEKEEAYYLKTLEKARREFMQSYGNEQYILKHKIEKLERELKDVQEKKERALSMAQQTKRGHVYIISNVGAFGENVYKIGMTRRLEPIDRVRELGDASVPFQFDVHAMIYSDEARTLEYELHKAFTDKKVNMLNYRKEFFKVTLEEIEETIKNLGFEAEFTKIPEAMQYRETLAILEKRNNPDHLVTLEEALENEFPSSLVLH